MKRIYIKDLSQSIGQEIWISGWVDVRRDQGKMVFIDIRDMSGRVQCVVLPSHAEAMEQVKNIRKEWVITARGIVNARPAKNVKADVQNGNIELEILEVKVLAEAKDLPFEKDNDLNLDTYLDYLPLTLRSQRGQDIFKVQETIIQAFREALKKENFTEFQAPAIVGGDAEGGAMAFKVEYYYEKTAFLATSPQFYKQIMTAVYEKVFTTPKIFRGEKHATSRHLSELTQMDFEMAFIESELDVMEVLERVIKHIVLKVKENHTELLGRFSAELPLVADKFPILTLREAQKVLGVAEDPDLEPEQERQICEWAKREHGSDFIFITKFPTSKRAFYTYEEPSEAPYSRGFDLLFRGLEINSGAQRINNYESLVKKMLSVGLDPEKFSFYLQAFKYGIPPHGGCSTGLERITARMLELPNVKEAALFPRDLNRIDNKLSQ